MRWLVMMVFLVACGGNDANVPSDPFWRWFASNADSVGRTPALVDMMKRIQVELTKSHPGVLAEIGGERGDYTLVLSADGNPKVMPLVQALFASRPAKAPGWTIVAFRQRDLTRPLRAIEFPNLKFLPSTIRYTAVSHDGKLDLQLFVPGDVEGDNTRGLAVFVALDHLIGEYDVEMKLGTIDVACAEHVPSAAHSLDDLPREVDALRTP